jgi:GntR family transcriptional regulator
MSQKKAKEAPLYANIEQALRKSIAKGTFPVGSLLPTEIALSADYGVSRQTIREAIRRLAEDGIVVRRRAIGTLVRSAEPIARYEQQAQTVDQLLQFANGSAQKVARLGDAPLPDEWERFAGNNPPSKWLKIVVARFAPKEEQALCVSEVFVHPQYSGVVRKLAVLDRKQEFKRPFFRMIEKHYEVHVAQVQQFISAEACRADMSEYLGIKTGEPVLQIARIYQDADSQPVQISLNTYRASAYRHVTTLTVDAQA